VDCIPAYVVRLGDAAPVVFLARAPHLKNDPLEWNPSRKLFVSPAHGESFDLRGRMVQGPAVHDLWQCPTNMVGGELLIALPEGAGSDAIIASCYGGRPPPG